MRALWLTRSAALGVIQSRAYDGATPPPRRTVGLARPLLPGQPTFPRIYTQFLDPNGLKGARIGITRVGLNGFTNVVTPAPVTAAVEAAFKALSDAGATVIDLDAAGFSFTPAAGEFGVLLYDFKKRCTCVLCYPRRRTCCRRDTTDSDRLHNTHTDIEMPFFNQDLFDLANSLDTSDRKRAAGSRPLRQQTAPGMSSYNVALDLDQAAGVSMGPGLEHLSIGRGGIGDRQSGVVH